MEYLQTYAHLFENDNENNVGNNDKQVRRTSEVSIVSNSPIDVINQPKMAARKLIKQG